MWSPKQIYTYIYLEDNVTSRVSIALPCAIRITNQAPQNHETEKFRGCLSLALPLILLLPFTLVGYFTGFSISSSSAGLWSHAYLVWLLCTLVSPFSFTLTMNHSLHLDCQLTTTLSFSSYETAPGHNHHEGVIISWSFYLKDELLQASVFHHSW